MSRGRTPREREEEDQVDWGDVWLTRREAHAERDMERMENEYERYIFGDDL